MKAYVVRYIQEIKFQAKNDSSALKKWETLQQLEGKKRFSPAGKLTGERVVEPQAFYAEDQPEKNLLLVQVPEAKDILPQRVGLFTRELAKLCNKLTVSDGTKLVRVLQNLAHPDKLQPASAYPEQKQLLDLQQAGLLYEGGYYLTSVGLHAAFYMQYFQLRRWEDQHKANHQTAASLELPGAPKPTKSNAVPSVPVKGTSWITDAEKAHASGFSEEDRLLWLRLLERALFSGPATFGVAGVSPPPDRRHVQSWFDPWQLDEEQYATIHTWIASGLVRCYRLPETRFMARFRKVGLDHLLQFTPTGYAVGCVLQHIQLNHNLTQHNAR